MSEMGDKTHPAAVWVFHQAAVQTLKEVLSQFEKADIRAFPVKGIVLAHCLYDDVSERRIQDIDLRVRPRDFWRAMRAARKAGYTILRGSKQLGAFEFEVSGLLVEVESTIGPPGVCAIGVGEMMERAHIEEEPFGFSHLEPELHDHALVLCVNTIKDKLLDAPPWSVEDLGRIVRLPNFDPLRFVALLHRAQLAGAVWILADWLAREKGFSEWGSLRDRIGKRPPRRMYASLFRRFLGGGHGMAMPLRLLARGASDQMWRRWVAWGAAGVGTVMWSSRR